MNSKVELSWQPYRRFFHKLGYLSLGPAKTASSYSMGLQKRHRDKNARNPEHPRIVHRIARTQLVVWGHDCKAGSPTVWRLNPMHYRSDSIGRTDSATGFLIGVLEIRLVSYEPCEAPSIYEVNIVRKIHEGKGV